MDLKELIEAKKAKAVIPQELEPQDLQELEEIIDNELEEVALEEELIKELEAEEMQVSNNILYKKLNDIEDTFREVRTQKVNETVATNTRLELIWQEIQGGNENIKQINTKINKKFLIFVVSLVAIASFALGMVAHANKDEISPYTDKILNISSKVAEKAVTHGMGN